MHNHVFYVISLFLDGEDLFSLSFTSKSIFESIKTNDPIWISACLRDFYINIALDNIREPSFDVWLASRKKYGEFSIKNVRNCIQVF